MSIVKGDLAKTAADALVNAAAGTLQMSGGVAAALRKQGGKDVEEEALELAPIEVGQVIATTAGKLNAKFVLHAAVIAKPGAQASAESIRKSLRNALDLADSLDCQTIGIPALGCGAGGFDKTEGARLILSALSDFSAQSLQHAFVVLHSDETLKAFETVASELGIKTVPYVPPKALSVESSDESRPSEESDEVLPEGEAV
ncbi:MAG: macro domain-containing protein [Candidatus Diapherotrites archaeon]|nr:macro domain-containing protein [Candidatus Diapherotrites archaeon]